MTTRCKPSVSPWRHPWKSAWWTWLFLLTGVLSGGTAIARSTGEAPLTTLDSKHAVVDGLDLHYLSAGAGDAVLLLHGFTETADMWRPIIPHLAARFRVIAPDLPGIGASGVPDHGYDMKSAAERIHALAASLGVTRVRVVGHDIGLMVAYAYAARYPNEVERLVLMDAFLPGIGAWESYVHSPKRWHFFFNGPTPEALVRGRERV